MIKRVSRSKSKMLLSRDDRAFLKSFRDSSKRHVAKVTRTRAAAMQELVAAGIYDADGKLNKQYR